MLDYSSYTQKQIVLLKASDVAQRLNISRSQAYQLMKSGSIPTVRIRRSVRVKESDLVEFIHKQWSGWS